MDNTYNESLNELKKLENNFNFLSKHFLNGITLSGVDDGGLFNKNKLYIYLNKKNYIELTKSGEDVSIVTKNENILICLEIISIIKMLKDYSFTLNNIQYFIIQENYLKSYENVIKNVKNYDTLSIVFKLNIEEPKISI